MEFTAEYEELQERFRRQVAEDRDVEELNEHQHIWLPMTFFPRLPARGAVETVFIGMYPSQNWLREKDPARKLIEAQRKVDGGFRISLSTILDLIFHLAIRDFLLRDGQTYYVTDVSKGAMERKDEEMGRADRWPRWYPLLKHEMKIVIGDPSAAKARVIPIGVAVTRFLKQRGFHDWLECEGLGALTSKITHWGDRGYAKWATPAHMNFFEQHGARIQRLAANLLDEVDAAPWWRDHVEENVEKAFLNPQTEWQCQWLFEKYYNDFRDIGGNGPDAGKQSGEVKEKEEHLSSAWEDEVKRVLERHSLAHDDKRARGGCFWVFGGPALESELKPLGFTFSKKKLAWWRK